MADKKKITITWKETNEGVDWAALADLLNRAFGHELEPVNKPGYTGPVEKPKKDDDEGGFRRTAESTRTVFSNSYAVVYAYDGSRLIACGRAISDGLEEAAIYNIAVDPGYQGYGLGRSVIEKLLKQVEPCTTVLFTHPQTVKFYETLGWRRMKTGFTIHPGRGFDQFEEEAGFILPEGFRYEVDESEYYEVPPEHDEKL